MKRGSHQRNKKSVDQEGKRESFTERDGRLQLRRRRLATVLLPLCAQTGLKAPDGLTISDKNMLQSPVFCLLDQRQSSSYPGFLLGKVALQRQNMVAAGFGRLLSPLNGIEDTLHALQDWRGRLGLLRRLEGCLPGLVQLIQTHQLFIQTRG